MQGFGPSAFAETLRLIRKGPTERFCFRIYWRLGEDKENGDSTTSPCSICSPRLNPPPRKALFHGLCVLHMQLCIPSACWMKLGGSFGISFP